MPKRKAKEWKAEEVKEEDEEERYFLNPASVSCHLYCSICQEVFSDPYRAPCGHSYCKKCITEWLKKRPTCPEDRKPVQTHQLHHDFILENIIGDQMVACPFRRAGCSYISQLQMLKSHKKKCDFNPANLPSFLKEEDENLRKKRLSNIDDEETLSDLDNVPPPEIPSLKMRLFRAGEAKKRLLSSMFEEKDTSAS